MRTLSITEGKQNLAGWLRRALRGEDVGFLMDGRVVALRPVAVHSEDYALQEYGVSEKKAELACKAVRVDIEVARASGQTKPFTGKL